MKKMLLLICLVCIFTACSQNPPSESSLDSIRINFNRTWVGTYGITFSGQNLCLQFSEFCSTEEGGKLINPVEKAVIKLDGQELETLQALYQSASFQSIDNTAPVMDDWWEVAVYRESNDEYFSVIDAVQGDSEKEFVSLLVQKVNSVVDHPIEYL